MHVNNCRRLQSWMLKWQILQVGNYATALISPKLIVISVNIRSTAAGEKIAAHCKVSSNV